MRFSFMRLNTDSASLGASARTQPEMRVLYVMSDGTTPASCISSKILVAS